MLSQEQAQQRAARPERALSRWRMRRPPKIRSLPFIGPIRRFTGDPVPFLTEMRKKYGDAFRFPIVGYDLTCICGDDAIALLHNDELLSTTESMLVLQKALKSPLPTFFDGPHHARYRRLHTKFLNRSLERANRHIIIDCIRQQSEVWQPGDTFDVLKQAQSQTVHVLSRILNRDEFPFTHEELSLVVHSVFLAAYGRVPIWIALNNPRYKSVKKRMDDHFLQLVHKVRQDPELIENTMIGQYLASPPPEGSDEWSDDDLKIIPLIAYLAGFDTTAASAGFLLYRLLSNPTWLSRVREEYRELPKDENGHVDPSQQVILDAVFQETSRINPPGALVMRYATQDFEFQGYGIRRGDEVLVQISSDHLDERYFTNPHQFDPSRFLSEDTAPLRRRVRTFGAGAHRCTGSVVGPLISKELVSYWVNHFDLELHPHDAKPKVMALPFTQPMGLTVRVLGRRTV